MKKILLALSLILVIAGCSTNKVESGESPSDVAMKFFKAYEDVDLVTMNPLMKTPSSEESIKKSMDLMEENPIAKDNLKLLIGKDFVIEKEEISSDGNSAVLLTKANRILMTSFELAHSQTNLDVLAISGFLDKPKAEQDKIFLEKFKLRLEKLEPMTVQLKVNLVKDGDQWKIDDMQNNADLFQPMMQNNGETNE